MGFDMIPFVTYIFFFIFKAIDGSSSCLQSAKKKYEQTSQS